MKRMKLTLLFLYILLPLSQAADYVVRIKAINVFVTASLDKDSLVGGLVVTGSGGVTNRNLTKVLGDYGGDRPIVFYPDQFEIRFSAGPTDHVQIIMSVVNQAVADETKLLQALVAVAGQVAGGLAQPISTLINAFIGGLKCDTTVVGDVIFLTPTDLKSLDAVDVQKTIKDKGSSPGLLCHSPEYYTAISITRLDKPLPGTTLEGTPSSSSSSSSTNRRSNIGTVQAGSSTTPVTPITQLSANPTATTVPTISVESSGHLASIIRASVITVGAIVATLLVA